MAAAVEWLSIEKRHLVLDIGDQAGIRYPACDGQRPLPHMSLSQ